MIKIICSECNDYFLDAIQRKDMERILCDKCYVKLKPKQEYKTLEEDIFAVFLKHNRKVKTLHVLNRAKKYIIEIDEK